MDLEADIDAMLSGLDSVEVVHGVNTSKGVINLVDSSMLEGAAAAALGEVRTVTIRTGAFPGLKTSDSITVGGTAYRVLDRRRDDDGLISHPILGNP